MNKCLCVNACCLEYMKNLPDKSVDLFICDLPYGCLTQQSDKKSKTENSGCLWDIKIDLEIFWKEVKRLCKNDNTPILMFCNTRFGNDLINSNKDWFRYDLVWNKNCGTNFLLANKMPMKSHEMIYVFSKKGAFYKRIDHTVEGKEAFFKKGGLEIPGNTYGNGVITLDNKQEDNTRCPLSVVNFPRIQDKRHQTCKSIELYKWLIERYSNEGDMVLDPTAGSFNSGRACKELNRSYIGIELDPDFYKNNKIDDYEIF